MKKLNPANKNLGLGVTLVEGSSSFPLGLNTGIFFPTYKGFCATDPNLPACQGKDVTIP